MLATSIKFYWIGPLMYWGSFLIIHFSRNTVNHAALIGSTIPVAQGIIKICSNHRTPPTDREVYPTATSWGNACLVLPACPLAFWESVHEKQDGKHPRRHKYQVSGGMLPHCLWLRQSHLPAETQCSMAFSGELLSSPREVEVLGTLICCLKSKKIL